MINDLMVAITVLANGYDVNITVNGRDIGITGGKSESLKLFGENHSMVPVLPEDMKKLVCLKKGANEIFFKFRCRDIESKSDLIIELKTKEQFVTDECLISLKEHLDLGKENTVHKTFTLPIATL
ncbi:hypothetical protein [Desulfobacula sp.]|uniref:hypothetical protein n=1 Tax=Desulfobacula sp. TaxID=2593537 RepID=UPI00262853D8|nr:hypothetical protein [Desulfobacula sp.]